MNNARLVHEGLDLVMTALRRRREELEGSGSPDLLDLLWQIMQEWQEARPTDRFPICLTHELRATRNRWAHQYEFSLREAYRAADTVEQFLRCLEAVEAREAEALRLRVLKELSSDQTPRPHGTNQSVKKEPPKREATQPQADAERETTIVTLGSPNKRTEFSYGGDIRAGVRLGHKDNAVIKSELFQAALRNLAGLTLRGGFSMTNPPAEGFGQWVVDASKVIPGQRQLTPRHGSFVAAILVHEAGVQSRLDGNTVRLTFPKSN